MTDQTPIDLAHAAMEAAPGDDAARLAFYERLADAELFVLLTEEAKDENLSPEVFEIADGAFILGFDREERLAQFVGKPAPYAALSGRVVASLLAAQNMGLGLNLEVAPSALLIPTEALAWLTDTLGTGPQQVEAEIAAFDPPTGLPERLLSALDAKLATARGLADAAYLVGLTYRNGARGHMLGFVDAAPGAQSALAKAAGEALTFSGIEAGAMDVGFFAASDTVTARMARVGLRFDLPQPEPETRIAPSAPGSDPDKPPILR